MMDFTAQFLGSPIWLWVIFLVLLVACAIIIIYVQREHLKGKYYKFRYYEKVIEVCMHHRNTQIIKSYWRLVPTKSILHLPGGVYMYDKEKVIKNDRDFAYKNNEQWKLKIDNIEYDLDLNKVIDSPHFKWPQIHYFTDCPTPINWDSYVDDKFYLKPKEFEEALESDAVSKAFSLARQDLLIMLGMIFALLSFLLGILNFAVSQGWIKTQ